VRRIEHFIGQPIPGQVIAGLEPTAAPLAKKPGKRFDGRRPGFNQQKPRSAPAKSYGFARGGKPAGKRPAA